MITYTFLQHYWWFLVSLLGALLVFLMFVQGANSLIFQIGRTEEERTLIVNSTGRKWEFTFTTLVTFGGAFFASFPLFYSTSFGGAYWVWMLILLSFVLQAVAYEFQGKEGNLLGRSTYRYFLVFNGIAGPFLLGAAVATFFTGSAFLVSKDAMDLTTFSPVISRWANGWHGLDALFNPWNWVLGIAVTLLARILGGLYLINNIKDEVLSKRFRGNMRYDTIGFLIAFLGFVGYLLTTDGFAVSSDQQIYLEPYKYGQNLLDMPIVLVLFLLGVVLVLHGILKTLFDARFYRGIWTAGFGTVFTVLALLLLAGFNQTAYYPSTADLQSSLTLANSCSSEFTLTAMSWVSLIIPFVLAYIAYAWHAIDKKSMTRADLKKEEHLY
ncbi:cytochrome D ubiquinol oxidase, subunit II [gut metagenome]|uniref:Cytochrome D ubiquinol oxidase, subunit II n=1 Tax=gut metagenome TaxID=749906 RepID=J9G0A7_9ZZZZ